MKLALHFIWEGANQGPNRRLYTGPLEGPPPWGRTSCAGTMGFVAMDDGTRLWTAATGTAGPQPPVVLVHGAPGLWNYLAPVVRLLEDTTLVHRYEQRGCGRSEPSDDQPLARHVEDLEALRRHWGYDRWTVVGHSFGAQLALSYAWTHLDRVISLGYVSDTGLGDRRTGYQAERKRRMALQQQNRLAERKALKERGTRGAGVSHPLVVHRSRRPGTGPSLGGGGRGRPASDQLVGESLPDGRSRELVRREHPRAVSPP